MEENLHGKMFGQLQDVQERVVTDIPAALRTLVVQDQDLVAYEVVFVVDPQPPFHLYWAFVRGTPVFDDEEASGKSEAAAAPIEQGGFKRRVRRNRLDALSLAGCNIFLSDRWLSSTARVARRSSHWLHARPFVEDI